MKKEIKLWDKVSRSFHKTSLYSRAHRDKYIKVAKLAISRNPNSILDLGCGSGILEKELLNMGFRGTVLAVDGSRKMLKIARNYVVDKKIHFVLDDLDKPIFLEKKFDVIISINLLFFLDNKGQFFKSVNQIMRDRKSTFILIIPKPVNESDMFEFIRAHFTNKNKREKIIIAIRELVNLPRYFKTYLNQYKIDQLEKKGIIKYDTREEIFSLAKNNGLVVISVDDIHAKQNLMFVFRRV